MKRKICDYYLDERNDWVAVLDCYHGQHVRHKPPFTNRPWVESEAGRAEKIGLVLDCVRCDRFEFPEGLVSYQQTPAFTGQTVPAGLLKDHSTKSGTWGLIKVIEGCLVYRAGDHVQRINAGEQGVVVPEMLHSVTPEGPVLFYVEFFRKSQSTGK